MAACPLHWEDGSETTRKTHRRSTEGRNQSMGDIRSGRVCEDVPQNDVDVALLVVDVHVLVRCSEVANGEQLLDQRIGLVQETLLLFLQTNDGRVKYLPIEIE